MKLQPFFANIICTTFEKIGDWLLVGPPRGKRDGVIGHISERENGNWMEKMRYCVID